MIPAGCVFSEPPVHGEATQTPPVLYPNQAVPSPYEVVTAAAGETVTVNVPIRSEDDGEDLFAELRLDYSIAGAERLLAAAPVTAGTLGDDSRAVDIAAELPSIAAGCHQLTLVVTHQSNVKARDKSDIATVSWWLNVDDADDPASGNLLRDCPKNTGTPTN